MKTFASASAIARIVHRAERRARVPQTAAPHLAAEAGVRILPGVQGDKGAGDYADDGPPGFSDFPGFYCGPYAPKGQES